MPLSIIRYPDVLLKTACPPVVVFDKLLRALIAGLFETMYAADGIGLAAPQVGILQRVFVMDLAATGKSSEKLTFVNPKIVSASPERVVDTEGCLSLPGVQVRVQRHRSVTVAYVNGRGKPKLKTYSGLAARCIQHELDHVDGILIVDREFSKV